jgi:hypothetical protein
MIKLFYLAKRKPDLTRDQFIKRWRKHGALGMSTAFWRHALTYVQAEPISPASIPGMSEEYDAIAYLTYADAAFSDKFTPQDVTDSSMMLMDERETFAGPIPNVSFWLQEGALKVGDPGGTTAFLFFIDGGKAHQIAEGYKNSEGASRVAINTRRDDVSLGSFQTAYPYRAVVEVAASNSANLKEVIGTDSAAPWRKSDLAIVAREAVLWDRLSPP